MNKSHAVMGAAILGILLLVASWLAAYKGEELLVLTVILVPALIYVAVRGRLNSLATSPVTIAAGVFWMIGTFGYLLRHFLAETRTGASILIVLTEDEYFRTLVLMSSFTSLILVTAALALSRSPRAKKFRIREASWRAPAPSLLLFLAALLPIGVMLYESGPALLERPEYLLGTRGTLLGGIGGALYTAGVVLVGYLFGASRGSKRLLSLAILAPYVLLLFSFGSRRFAMIPVLFAIGALVAQNTKTSRRGVIWGGVATLALLPLPLMMRRLDRHGLFPYLEALPKTDFWTADWAGAVNNILVAFPIIGETAYGRGEVFPSDLWVAVNPMPGSMAGWYDISHRFLLNPFTPYAGIGELGNVGWMAVVGFAVLIGLALAWAEKAVRRNLAEGRFVFASALIGLSGLFALQVVQYTLRSSLRLLLYLIALEVARRVIASMVRKKQARPRQATYRQMRAARR